MSVESAVMIELAKFLGAGGLLVWLLACLSVAR